MIEASCHCGMVRLTVPESPAEVTECNCSICRRYGAIWAYYGLGEVGLPTEADGTDTYIWDDEAIRFHRCRTCGCMTHWLSIDPAGARMGLNSRMLPIQATASARKRFLDGAVTERYIDEVEQ